MSDSDMYGDSVYERGDAVDDAEELDPFEELSGNDSDETMQTGYNPPDRETHNMREALTPREERMGESLDEHLAEEEPEIWDVETPENDDVEAEPRAGRLVAPDEGSHEDREADEIATDVGPAGYASSAEEAAMHIVADDREV